MRDFKWTMDVLIKAYMNDTLEHSNCAACAVGNMIAASNGIKYKKDRGNIEWDCYRTAQWYNHTVFPSLFAGFDDSVSLLEMESTGYSLNEIVKIEKAFESCDYGSNTDEYMFNGLLAVLDVLCEIHGVGLDGKKEYVGQLEAIYQS